MKRIFLSLATSFIILIAIFAFLLPKVTHAVDFKPTTLTSNPVCIGGGGFTSAIEFNWRTPQEYDDFNWRLWYTGLSTFKDVAGSEAEKPYIEVVNPDTQIEWWVEVCDKDFSFPNQCQRSDTETVRSFDCTKPLPVPPPPPVVINCENRPDSCPKSDFPECEEFSSAPWRCSSPHCTFGSIDFPLFCAYKDGEPRPGPSCDNFGDACDDSFSRTGIATCCSGLICDPFASSEGTCRAAPTEFGDLCYTCKAGTTWDREKGKEGSCVDRSGNKTQEDHKGFCSEDNNLTCVQGAGCKSTKGFTNTPLSAPCNTNNPGAWSEKEGCKKIKTALGFVPTNAESFVRVLFGLILGIAGTVLLFVLIFNGYKLMTSQGDPEKIKDARDGIIAGIAGILLIILSLLLIRLITVNVLGLPGFG